MSMETRPVFDLKIMAGPAWGKYADTAEMDHVFRRGELFGAGFETGRGRLSFEIDAFWFAKTSFYPSRSWFYEMREISVPVLVKLHRSAGPLRLSIGAGGEAAYILSHKTYNWSREGSLFSDATDRTRKTDFGLVFSAGAAIRLGKLSFGAEARYHHGLVRKTHEINDYHDLFRTREIVVLGVLGLTLGKAKS